MPFNPLKYIGFMKIFDGHEYYNSVKKILNTFLFVIISYLRASPNFEKTLLL